MAVMQLNQSNFEDTIVNNDFVVLDFWAPWCGPCRSFGPVFEAESQNHPDAVFGKINTDEEQVLAAQFQIRSIPTLMIFREKVLVYSQPGALPAGAFRDLLTKASELDMKEVHAEIAKRSAQA